MVCASDEFAMAEYRIREAEKKVMERCFLNIGVYLTTRKLSNLGYDFDAKKASVEAIELANEKLNSWKEDRENKKLFGRLYSEKDFELFADLLWSCVLGMEGPEFTWWDDALQTAYTIYCTKTGRNV